MSQSPPSRRNLFKAGKTPLEGKIENICRLLTDNDASTADRTRIQRRLERRDDDITQAQKNVSAIKPSAPTTSSIATPNTNPGTDPLEEAATTIN